MILMYAQKVLTQEHCDTKATLKLISTEPYLFPETEQQDADHGCRGKRIVDFPNFTSDRIRLDSGIVSDHQCTGSYQLPISISAQALYESRCGVKHQLKSERALFIPAASKSYRMINTREEPRGFLLATPKPLSKMLESNTMIE